MCPKLEQLHHMHGVLRTQRHRATGVLAGEYGWGHIQIADYVRRYSPGTVLWISDNAPRGSERLPVSRARSVLGRETGVIVFDGFAGFDIDALGAVGGSIRGGGLLLHPLILPSVSARPEFLLAGSVIERDESNERQHSYKKSSCPLQPQGQHHRHHPYSAQQLPPVLYRENTKI